MVKFSYKYNTTVLLLGLIFSLLLCGVIVYKIYLGGFGFPLLLAGTFIVLVNLGLLALFFTMQAQYVFSPQSLCFRLYPLHKIYRCISWHKIEAVYIIKRKGSTIVTAAQRSKFKRINYRLGARHAFEVITKSGSIYTLGASSKDIAGIAKYASKYVKVI